MMKKYMHRLATLTFIIFLGLAWILPDMRIAGKIEEWQEFLTYIFMACLLWAECYII